jgi:regulator of sirC expression with transglutaminase-like and TPR domain
MDKEIKALIHLLDDPDKTVYQAVTEKISEKGLEAVPSLEKAWESTMDQEIQQKIEDLIQFIQFRYVSKELEIWANDKHNDLLYGAYLVAKYQYPDLYFSEIEERIEQIRKDVWLELNDNLTALEKVRVINHILFVKHRFNRNSHNFYAPGNSFLNQVIETKKGNPISLSIIYTAVAEKLGLPVAGVNLPLNYILAWKDPYFEDDPNGILFYINPFKKGSVLSKKDVDHFLNQQKLEPKPEYYIPCSNNTTIERTFRNLIFAYEKLGYKDKVEEITHLLKIVQAPNH